MARALNQRDHRLLDQIKQALKANAQFAQHLAGGASEDVDKIRSLGRRAGRELGWKVRTFVRRSADRDDHTVRVLVVVEQSSPLHDELIRLRGAKAIRRAFVK
jgi:hypothetical protein